MVDTIIVYTDASYHADRQYGKWGVVLQARENVRIVKERRESGVCRVAKNNNAAELIAIAEALKILQPTTLPITLFTDSRESVRAIERRDCIVGDQGLRIVGWIRQLQKKFPNLKIRWIKREFNLAHNLTVEPRRGK